MAAVNDVPQLVDKKGGNCAVIATILEPTPDERRVVLQDQRLKSIIMSCLPDDIMESVISYVLAKETWTDLVHSFDGPSNTKENRIIDLKLKYQTFRAKSIESLSQTYTRYKTLLNELANDGVNLFKHEINGLRNANHTQTLDLADIYGRFVYKDNLIQRRYCDTKKALITIPSSTLISTAFFSNNVIQDFQENSDNERASEEYLRDLDIEYHEIVLLANSKHFIKQRNNFSGQKANENTECYKCGNKGHFARDYFSKTSKPSYKSPVNNYSSVSKGFQPKFTSKLIQSSSNSNSQVDPKFQKDYKAEYKKMKAKLALLEEEVSDEEEVTQVKVLMALADDEHTVVKSHARNAKLDIVTFHIQNTELTKLNHALQEQLKEEKKINEKWLTSSKKVSQCIGTVTVSETKQTTPLVPTEIKDIEQESKINELTKLVQMLINEKVNFNQKTQESNSKIQKTESSKSVDSSRMRILYCMICKKEEHRTSDHKMYIASLKRSENYKAQPYQYASSSKHILKAKKKPFPPCTHYGFNDHRPDDCRNYPECEICRSYDHFTSGHNRVIHIRGGVLAESSQSNESSIGVKCNTCGSTIHSTTKHNEFDHFK
ncbi:retrovirus-related pol polyprotein from transposon TNT 1-94 [Tanacetum coccineum]